MKLIVQRQAKTPFSISGEMTLNGKYLAWTLENAHLAIPAGTYEVELYPSPKFGRLMPRLKDVPGCPYCEVHWANMPSELEGCLGVGMMKGEDRIWNSREKFAEIYPLFQAAVNTDEGCSIEIRDIPAMA